MSITRTKTFKGPFTATLQDNVPASIYSIAGLKRDSIKVNLTQNEIEESLEDDSKEYYKGGVDLEVVLTHSEVDTADLDSMISAALDSLKIEFTAKSKTLTISSLGSDGVLCAPSIENLQTKLVIKKSYPIGTKLSDIMTIT